MDRDRFFVNMPGSSSTGTDGNGSDSEPNPIFNNQDQSCHSHTKRSKVAVAK